MFGRWFWILSAYSLMVCFFGALVGSILAFPLSTNLLIAALGSVILRKLETLAKRSSG
jgi:hypothetical protein